MRYQGSAVRNEESIERGVALPRTARSSPAVASTPARAAA